MTLPKGWAVATLGECSGAIQYGLTCTSSTHGEHYRYIRITDIQDRQIAWENVPFADVPAEKAAPYRVKTGDLLFARTGATVGKSFLVCEVPMPAAFASYLIRVQCNQLAVLPQFAAWYFQSPRYWEQILDGAEGTGQPNFNGTKLATLALNLAPISEQRRIVAKLDALTARLARARAELDRVPVLVSHLRSTTLANTYSALCQRGSTAPIKHFIDTLDQGWSPKCENYPAADDQAWAVLKTTSIQALDFRPIENKALPSGLNPRPKIEVKAGDILVTRAGPRVRCGVACMVRRTRPKLMLADKMYRLRCNPDRAAPGFIAFMLNAPQSLALIETMKTGISDSGLNLTQDKFLALPIPIASVKDQLEVVAKLEIAFARADRLETEAARAITLLDRLEAAILARAFRGELVPQDPNEEPASVLLDRIRAERAATPKPRRGRRAKQGE